MNVERILYPAPPALEKERVDQVLRDKRGGTQEIEAVELDVDDRKRRNRDKPQNQKNELPEFSEDGEVNPNSGEQSTGSRLNMVV